MSLLARQAPNSKLLKVVGEGLIFTGWIQFLAPNQQCQHWEMEKDGSSARWDCFWHTISLWLFDTVKQTHSLGQKLHENG